MTADSYTYDIVVVGAGTAGTFAAATAANAGMSVALLDRKSEAEAGHISCGDAIKGAETFPDVIDREYLREESFSNSGITRAIFGDPDSDDAIEIPFGETNGVVLDRKRYGEVLIEEAERAGADVQYNTVVNDVLQDETRVTGVSGTHRGRPVTYNAEVVIDATGAFSVLQDKATLDATTFETSVDYSQFCSAYREVVEVSDPVAYDDAIVFKPTEELGYLWYFPRTDTEINVGLGFQMTEEPMELVEVLKRDLQQRPEFQDATVTDKLGASLPTRRPYDSAVAPGFIAAGDAAAHVNPTTGGGIPGAAKAGTWAAEHAVDAITTGEPTEAALWGYNRDVMTDFGKRFAAMDLYNIWGTAHDIEELTDVVTSVPGQQLVDALGRSGTASMGPLLKLKTLANTFGHWGLLYELYQVHEVATDLKSVYESYPASPSEFAYWQERRDQLLDEVYAITGADPKY